ncbi:MAG: hypothetical protein ACXWP4_12675 [Polyangiales bacterium]
MKRNIFILAALAAVGCGSREVAPKRDQASGRASRADCFSTVRIHDVAGRGANGQPIAGFPTNNTVIDIVKLDSHDRMLIKETDFGDLPGGSNGAIGTRAYVWDGGPRTLTIPAGFDELDISAMNDLSQVVGSALVKSTGARRPFIWSADGKPALLPFDGHPVAINNLGHIAFAVSTGVRLEDPHLFLFRDGETIAIGDGKLTDMNDSDEMVGTASTDHVAMYWKVGAAIKLGSAGVRIPDPHINASGTVALSIGSATFLRHAFTWKSGVLRDLGTLAGGNSSTAAINDHGDVVGGSVVDPNHPRGFLWRDGAMVDLDTSHVFGGIVALDVNESRQVVGGAASTVGTSRPFLWEDGALDILSVDKATYPGSCKPDPATDAQCRTDARKINDRGTIAGVIISDHDGGSVPFLLVDHCAKPPNPSGGDAGPEVSPPPPEEPTE